MTKFAVYSTHTFIIVCVLSVYNDTCVGFLLTEIYYARRLTGLIKTTVNASNMNM